MEAIMWLACGSVKTLTETRGQRSYRPLAASLWGFAFAFSLRAAERTESDLELKQTQD